MIKIRQYIIDRLQDTLSKECHKVGSFNGREFLFSIKPVNFEDRVRGNNYAPYYLSFPCWLNNRLLMWKL